VENEISTKQLEKVIGSRSHCICDVRPVDAYNGWTLEGEKRGGHIMGAKAMPISWTYEENWDEIMRNKGIMPNHRIVVYGYTKDDAMEAAERSCLGLQGSKRL
jgi:3-mercaptopyruvate sulfurtransferase SseA